MNKTQKGRSMVEMLGVLAIVGVLSVGGIMAYNMAMTKFKTTKQMDQIQMVMTNIKTLFASQANYTGLSNLVLINLGVLNTTDNKAAAADSLVEDAFGGQISVDNQATCAGALGTAPANGCYTIQITNIPKAACGTIVNSDWGDEDGGLLDITVESGKESNDLSKKVSSNTVFTRGSADTGRLKPEITEVATLCAKGKNRITFLVK